MTRRRWLLAAAVLAVACGRKARPVAPELVRPKPPSDIVAASTYEGVRLRFARPKSYTSGRRMSDLRGFIVERAKDQGGDLAFSEAATIEIEDRYRFRQERRVEWLDRDAEEGSRYAYRVMALTLDGYRSEAAGPVAIDFKRPPKPPADEKSKEPEAPASAH